MGKTNHMQAYADANKATCMNVNKLSTSLAICFGCFNIWTGYHVVRSCLDWTLFYQPKLWSCRSCGNLQFNLQYKKYDLSMLKVPHDITVEIFIPLWKKYFLCFVMDLIYNMFLACVH